MGIVILALVSSIFSVVFPVAMELACAVLILITEILIIEMYSSYYVYIYSDALFYADTQDRAFQLYMLGDFELIMSQFIFANYPAKYLKKTGETYQTSYGKSSLNSLKNTENFTDSAIEHIFEGSVKNGKASGYHYECIENTAGRVVPGTEIQISDSGVYKAQVEVGGILKTGNRGYSTFFPKSMSPQNVIDAINEAYISRVFKDGDEYYGYSSEGIKITMYINEEGKIISAFPAQ